MTNEEIAKDANKGIPPEDITMDPDGGDAPAAEPTLDQQLAELKDKNLRLMAEIRNITIRAQREKSDALRYAEADFARELLTPLDDLERTLESAGQSASAETLAEGVRIARDHFLKILKSRGVEPIDAAGKPFDPSLHEALLQQPSDQPAGTVLTEATRGYRMHERVLRTSKVILSKGPAGGEA
jgi:molecular chaperone GrpE